MFLKGQNLILKFDFLLTDALCWSGLFSQFFEKVLPSLVIRPKLGWIILLGNQLTSLNHICVISCLSDHSDQIALLTDYQITKPFSYQVA